jgi:hypothetical protein
LSRLTPSLNLHQPDIFYLFPLEEDDSPEIVVLSEMMPNIREFQTSESTVLMTRLLHAKLHVGRPAFNFMDLRRLSMNCTQFKDKRNVRYLLQNAKLLEELQLSVGPDRTLLGLHKILSPLRTLNVLDLTLPLHDSPVRLPLGGLCKELEAMAGHNMLEAHPWTSKYAMRHRIS